MATTLHPLLQRLTDSFGYALLDAQRCELFAAAPGNCVLLFAGEPERYRETLDVAVVLPELVMAADAPPRVGVLAPAAAAAAVAPRYGVRVWPSLVFLRGGSYLGAIEGLRDWSDFRREFTALLDAEPCRPPGIGIAVSGATGAACH